MATSHATRAAQQAAGTKKDQTVAPKEELPFAKVNLHAHDQALLQPAITLADGTVVSCPHTAWGHLGEKAATSCAKSMASKHGVRLS